MTRPYQVIIVAGEAVPFAKVGGLADVIGALPIELDKLGIEVSVVIPRYRVIELSRFGFEKLSTEGRISLGGEEVAWDVHVSKLPNSSVKVFLIGNDRFFGREGIYLDAATGRDYSDQADRWIFFQRAAMEFLTVSFPSAGILHCHDHQTGLIPAYLEKIYRPSGVFRNTGTIFTIHNMGYQGLFSSSAMTRTGFSENEFYPASPFEFFGRLNFMKVGICFADLITTVSETYAREIQESREFGYGLEGVLRERSDRLVGILNGMDGEIWNPETDSLIAATFSISDLSGKARNRNALLSEFGLDPSRIDRPVLAMISRIDVQKGFDLLVTILDYLLSRDLFFVLLGSGNRETEGYLRSITERHRDKASFRFAFDNRLAHLTEAGADMFLMPSKYEPCGLNQMYSLRYGTVPIVRSTGGLADTVREFDPATGSGTGFCFTKYDADDFKAAIGRALTLWSDRNSWRRIMLNGMTQDLSWKKSARKYVEAYERVLGTRNQP
jgi:starch synthase